RAQIAAQAIDQPTGTNLLRALSGEAAQEGALTRVRSRLDRGSYFRDPATGTAPPASGGTATVPGIRDAAAGAWRIGSVLGDRRVRPGGRVVGHAGYDIMAPKGAAFPMRQDYEI